MKKNLVLIMAVLLSAACQKNEEPVVLQDASIDFAAYVGRGATKGVVTDVTAANLDTFRVACYNTGTATSYFATEQKATKNNDKYKTSTPYYWPSGDVKLDFFAYRGTVTNGVSNTSGTATIAYTVPAAADEDFVGASAVNQGKSTSVGLAFDHLLTKIDSLVLAPITNGTGAIRKYKYKFTAVEISAPKDGGTYTFNTKAWALSGSEATYKFATQSGDFLGSDTKTLKTGAVNDQLIFLPQKVTFNVTYSVEYAADGSNWTEIMSSITKKATIALDKGVAYGITLHLPIDASAASEIVFEVTVNDWGKDSKDVTLE